MFKLIAKYINKAPKRVTAVLLIAMLLAGALGSGVAKRLTSGGFEYQGAESYQALQRIQADFGKNSTNLLLLVTIKDGTIDNPENVVAALKLEQSLKDTKYISGVTSYWTAGKVDSLKGNDAKQALIIGTVDGTEKEVAERIKPIAASFTNQNDQLQVGVGGFAEINHQFTKQIEHGLHSAEAIALPITLIILLLVFRSLVAAALPIIIGVFAIFGSLFVLRVLTQFTSVSIYALNLATMMGLGLAIDYSLFIVSRFREQLALGDTVQMAVKHTIQKAGKTVLFSALTVAVSLATLMVFPQSFLKSFAYAGVAVALVAAVGAVVLLPALLKLIGKNINKFSIGKAAHYEKGSEFWHHVATLVMKRPVVVTITVVTLLLLLGSPFLHMYPGRGDERSLPTNNPARVVHDQLRNNFNSRKTAELEVVSTSSANVTAQAINSYAALLSTISCVDHVEAATGIYAAGKKLPLPNMPKLYNPQKGTWLAVIPSIEPYSKSGETLVKTVRATPAPFTVLVGGQSASLVDLKTSIYQRLPLALALIAIATFILLFTMFGGILVPIVALTINVLTLSAVFGIITAIFQDGNLAGILHFTPTGMIEATMPILMFCVAFGLSMDYEMFLLSRIKEHYNKAHNNRLAIAYGLERTGGIVTAAAISISVVFLAFASSSVSTIKLFGLGLSIAVLLDAFIIRGTLVPAFMSLAKNANWWAPKSLKHLYNRFGIKE